MSRSMRLPAAIAVTVVVAAAFAAVAQSRPPARAVALPKVRVTSSAIEFHDRRALLVRSIVVSRIAGARLHISCGRCRRYPTKIRETHPRRGVKRFSGVNWIVVAGRSIRVVVTHKGRLGRFLVLGVGKGSERHSLVYKASGCLSARQKRVACPRRGKRPPKGVVPGGSGGELRSNGIWQLFGSYGGAPQLGFIETGGESVEVHWDNLTGGAYTRAGDYSSDFVAGEAKNGILQLFGSANGAPQLGFIKTSNTGSGTVEVHWDVLEGGSYKRAASFTSDFGAGNAKNGVWQLFGSANGAPQLGFIKTSNTGSGTVEVHWDVLEGGSYKRAGSFTSDFSQTGAGEQVWQLVDTGAAPQLGIIVTSKSGSGTVEPHWDNLNGSTYTRAGDFISDFPLHDGPNGTWQLFGSGGGAPQLGLVKTSDTASGTVEVHWDVLSGSAYARAAAYTSDFSLADVTTSAVVR